MFSMLYGDMTGLQGTLKKKNKKKPGFSQEKQTLLFSSWLLINADQLGVWVAIFVVSVKVLKVHLFRITAFLYRGHFFHGRAPCRDSWVLGHV